ncbi:MAG TPA: MBL fold metallo-hydrolase [Solirubrobacteraceae bacterium]|jgi:glyoxylase-like metal-dependent hydrolase (beta-lactamase superfamily II)|nr:MBL fold metallo-hydrolase [Solirubrobacteraceae bacterium]
MKEIAEDVHLLSGWPPNAINVYLVGERGQPGCVLIDAATRQAEKRIFKQIGTRELSAHALTHVHPDHQGCSHAVCERYGVPLWCGQADVPAMESPGKVTGAKAPAAMKRLQERFWVGPPHPVARALHEGDEVAGFTVLETPGHTRGHVAFWRERDRVLILGDVLNDMNLMTGMPGLHEPPHMFAADPAQNRASARRLAALRPALACFGHGAPLRDPDRLARFVGALPA